METGNLYYDAYDYALDIDDNLKKTYGVDIHYSIFNNLTEVLMYPQTSTGQKKYFKFLITLSPTDLEERLSKLVILMRALKSIEKNKVR